MANYALQLKPDGTKERVYASNLHEEDKRQRYFCEGTCQYGPYRGQSCGTELRPVFCKDKENYFSTVKTTTHRKGCEFCEKAKEKRIQVLGRSCLDKTDVDILDNLTGYREKMQEKDAKETNTKGAQTNRLNNEGEDKNETLTVKKKFRPPKNAGELYDLLTTYSLSDVFAQKPVSEWIIDQRTFPHYYANGLEDGQIALALLGKMNPSKLPEELKTYTSQYYILPCTGYDWREKIFFLLPWGKPLKDEVISKQKAKELAVLAAWHRAGTIVQAYFCEDTPGKKQIAIISKSNV